MSAIINNSYLDFFNIAVDAYDTENRAIYRKLMTTIISTYKALSHEIELASSYLDKSEKLLFSETELETFYENFYDSIDIIKLYKQQLEPLKIKDGLFTDLYDVVNKLHLIMVEHLDRVSTLEARTIQQKYTKASY